MAKKYVKAYYDWKQQITALSDAEKGRLFIAILEYGETGEIPMLSGREAIIFPAFQAQIDRDNQVYQSKVENGRAGGLAKASERYRKLAKSSESYQDKEKEKDKDKEKEKVNQKEKAVFQPPTQHQVEEYCQENGLTVDCAYFVDHYNANGWKVGRSGMKDWKATVRNWARREKKAQKEENRTFDNVI